MRRTILSALAAWLVIMAGCLGPSADPETDQDDSEVGEAEPPGIASVRTADGALIGVWDDAIMHMDLTADIDHHWTHVRAGESGWLLLRPDEQQACGQTGITAAMAWGAGSELEPSVIPAGQYILAAHGDGNHTRLGFIRAASDATDVHTNGTNISAEWTFGKITPTQTPTGWEIDWSRRWSQDEIAVVMIGMRGLLDPAASTSQGSIQMDDTTCWEHDSISGDPVTYWLGGGGSSQGETIHATFSWTGPSAMEGRMVAGFILVRSADVVQAVHDLAAG